MISFGRLVGGVLFVATVVACGSGGGSAVGGGGSAAGGSSSGGPNASAGATMLGGSSAGGASAGAANGGGAGSAAMTAGHCTPGTPQPAVNFIGGVLDSCGSVSGISGTVNNILDIAPSKPVGPGQTFAFSVDLRAPEGDFELYGATRECGDVGELLSTVHVTGNGIICYEVKPTTATYSHLIWVWRVAAEMKNTAVCDAGVCPAH